MIQFGISTFVWVSPFASNDFSLLYKVADMGYDIIEVAVENKNLIDWQRLDQVARETGLRITISGAFGPDRDISSDDAPIRKNGLDYIVDCLQIAGNMGSPIFTGPVYSAVGKTRIVSADRKRQERNWCLDNLREAGEIARQCGVVIGIEPLNRFETDMINTAEQALSLVHEADHPFLKISLDTFHNNIEEKSIPAAIRAIGRDLLCHVQGNESDRGTPGTGNVDWIDIKAALTDIGYDGAVVIETFGTPSEELAKAASIWRPLANSPDELAIEGLAFYKTLFR
ncbi:sugar phosphate isomerase/epimerase family protein [Spirosoma utsteinense]|uniref:D-psicose/D-tagatose/L-ribulose 3-epimerase n=1 Tax=Spirosoma utsteinense TaxID=2585773 RepID=A0ABR6WDU5_9BACT|nr:sugar phosphate isomerase/epimerase family protein [Spirosoma utsteinense]MBC3788496.1 D-psicose/D-tagatose/L-ribulose 3-epimerase [Spirosoma utsteinense]MBC3794464.1 D-psicose/D-tagatose/L-ribulose 3-epimerase [Spirosoma utsteinense]